MRKLNDMNDVRIVLTALEDRINNLNTRSQNLHGNRVTNAGDAKDPQDYVTLQQITDFVAGIVPASLPRIIAAVTNNITNILGAGNWIWYDITLTASITLPDSPDAMPGTFIAIRILQDGVGGWNLTWPAKYIGTAGMTLSSTAANSYMCAIFYCVDPATEFLLLAPPILGVA